MKGRIPEVSTALALGVVGMTALVLAGCLRFSNYGVTTHLLDPAIAADPLAIAPDAALPAGSEVTSYVGPLEDPASLWQIGNMIDGWTATGRKIEQLPPAYLLARGSLFLFESGSWQFEIAPAPAFPAKIWIDGAPHDASTYLASGAHSFQLALKNDAGPAAFTVTAEGPGFPKAPLPDRLLTPEAGVPATVWVLALFGLGLSIASIVLFAKTPALLAELRLYAPLLVLLLAMILGTTLRAHGRLAAPKVGDTYDEYQEAWQGWSLVHLHAPIAWGFPPWQDAYRSHGKLGAMNFFGRQLMIVQPYLEHPPLFSLLVGISGTIAGAKTPFAVRLSAIRRVPLFLSLFFYPLLYAIARRLHGRHAAALACLVFALAPPFVLVMRFAKGDLLVALLALVSIWAGLRYREEPDGTREKRVWLFVCAIAAGLAPLAKELGIFALVLPALLLAPRRKVLAAIALRDHYHRLKPAIHASAIAFVTLLLYPLYGAIVDWERFRVFLRIQGQTRLGRFDAGAAFLETLFLSWKNQQVTVFAGGWILLWLAALWSLRGRGRLLATIALLYLATLVAAVDGRWLYGWYELPLFAPLAACAGFFLWDTIERPDLARPLALLVLGVLPLVPSVFTIADTEKMHDLRLAIFAAGAPIGVHAIVRAPVTRTIARIATGILVALFLVFCAAISWQIVRFYPGFALAA